MVGDGCLWKNTLAVELQIESGIYFHRTPFIVLIFSVCECVYAGPCTCAYSVEDTGRAALSPVLARVSH